ncbi:MAG: host attachment protein [Pseudomonadota bacterium]
MHRAPRTRILVANGSGARWVERRPGDIDPTTLLEARPSRDYRPGPKTTAHESAAGGMRHGAGERDVAARQVADFGRELAELVNAQHRRAEFDRLALVAPPRLLRAIRERLDAETRASVVFELAKDLTHVGNHDLRAWLHSPEFA